MRIPPPPCARTTLMLKWAHMIRRRVIQSKNSGFTIVELLIVVVVIAILAGLVTVGYNGISQRARESTLKSDLQGTATKLGVYRTTNDSYPATLGDNAVQSAQTNLLYTARSDGTYCLTAQYGSTNVSFFTTSDGALQSGTCPEHVSLALGCPTGFIAVPGNSTFGTSNFCVMKYEAKNDGSSNAVSQASGTPWVSINRANAIDRATAACSGCHLISEAEWLTLAYNVMSVPSNWSGGSVGTGYIYGGHVYNNPGTPLAASTDDTDGLNGITGGTGSSSNLNSRRTLTLTNGEVIWDVSGNVYEWVNADLAVGQPGYASDSAYAWREWNDSSMVWGSLPAISIPGSIAPTTSSWTSTQGIGRIYSNKAETVTKAFVRGGKYDHGAAAGVLSLNANVNATAGYAYLGFRAAR